MAEGSTKEPASQIGPLPSLDRLQGPAGIGGWLLLFIVGQIVALILNLQSAIDLSGFSREAWALGDHISIYRPLVVAEEAWALLLCIGSVVGLILLLRKRPETPRFYVVFLTFVAGYGLLEFGGMELLYPKLIAYIQTLGGATAGLVEQRSSQSTVGLRQIAYSLIWLLYWRTSRRVANTFPPALAQASPAPNPHL
jgi:hypothetical protein